MKRATEKELMELRNISDKHYEMCKNGEMTYGEARHSDIKNNKDSIQRVNTMIDLMNEGR